MGSLATWRSLTWRERRTFAAATVLLPVAAVALRTRGPARLAAFIAAASAPPLAAAGEQQRALETARMVMAAARRSPWNSCLPQSLVLQWLLQRSGIVSELRLGVRKTAGILDAHAWVEYHGLILNDGAIVHERFAAFDPPRAGVPPRGAR